MLIRASCPRCFVELQVPAEAQGRQLRCTQCGNVFLLDGAAEPAEVLPAGPGDLRRPIVRQTYGTPAISLGACQQCHRNVPTWRVGFHQHIGAVVLMFHRQINGKLCRECVDKYFWEYTLITLFAGWWGLISFFV